MSESAATKPGSWDPDLKPTSAAPGGSPTASAERGFFADLALFAWENKWWWITPTLLILVGLGVMVWFAQGQQIAPFFYALF